MFLKRCFQEAKKLLPPDAKFTKQQRQQIFRTAMSAYMTLPQEVKDRFRAARVEVADESRKEIVGELHLARSTKSLHIERLIQGLKTSGFPCLMSNCRFSDDSVRQDEFKSIFPGESEAALDQSSRSMQAPYRGQAGRAREVHNKEDSATFPSRVCPFRPLQKSLRGAPCNSG